MAMLSDILSGNFTMDGDSDAKGGLGHGLAGATMINKLVSSPATKNNSGSGGGGIRSFFEDDPQSRLKADPIWAQLLDKEKRTRLQDALAEARANPNNAQCREPPLSVGNVFKKTNSRGVDGGGSRGTTYALGAVTMIRRTTEEIVRSGRIALDVETAGAVRDARVLHVDPTDGIEFLATNEEIQSVYGGWWACLTRNSDAEKIFKGYQQRNTGGDETVSSTQGSRGGGGGQSRGQTPGSDLNSSSERKRIDALLSMPANSSGGDGSSVPNNTTTESNQRSFFNAAEAIAASTTTTRGGGGGGEGLALPSRHHGDHQQQGLQGGGGTNLAPSSRVGTPSAFDGTDDLTSGISPPLLDSYSQTHIGEIEYVAVMSRVIECLSLLTPSTSYNAKGAGGADPSAAIRAVARADWAKDSRGRPFMSYESFFLPLFVVSCAMYNRKRGSWVDEGAAQHHVRFLRELFLHVFPLPPLDEAEYLRSVTGGAKRPKSKSSKSFGGKTPSFLTSNDSHKVAPGDGSSPLRVAPIAGGATPNPKPQHHVRTIRPSGFLNDGSVKRHQFPQRSVIIRLAEGKGEINNHAGVLQSPESVPAHFGSHGEQEAERQKLLHSEQLNATLLKSEKTPKRAVEVQKFMPPTPSGAPGPGTTQHSLLNTSVGGGARNKHQLAKMPSVRRQVKPEALSHFPELDMKEGGAPSGGPNEGDHSPSPVVVDSPTNASSIHQSPVRGGDHHGRGAGASPSGGGGGGAGGGGVAVGSGAAAATAGRRFYWNVPSQRAPTLSEAGTIGSALRVAGADRPAVGLRSQSTTPANGARGSVSSASFTKRAATPTTFLPSSVLDATPSSLIRNPKRKVKSYLEKQIDRNMIMYRENIALHHPGGSPRGGGGDEDGLIQGSALPPSPKYDQPKPRTLQEMGEEHLLRQQQQQKGYVSSSQLLRSSSPTEMRTQLVEQWVRRLEERHDHVQVLLTILCEKKKGNAPNSTSSATSSSAVAVSAAAGASTIQVRAQTEFDQLIPGSGDDGTTKNEASSSTWILQLRKGHQKSGSVTNTKELFESLYELLGNEFDDRKLLASAGGGAGGRVPAGVLSGTRVGGTTTTTLSSEEEDPAATSGADLLVGRPRTIHLRGFLREVASETAERVKQMMDSSPSSKPEYSGVLRIGSRAGASNNRVTVLESGTKEDRGGLGSIAKFEESKGGDGDEDEEMDNDDKEEEEEEHEEDEGILPAPEEVQGPEDEDEDTSIPIEKPPVASSTSSSPLASSETKKAKRGKKK